MKFKFKVVLSPLVPLAPLDETLEIEATHCEVSGGALMLKLDQETVAVFPASGWKFARRIS